jgi:hypothetical protein
MHAQRQLLACAATLLAAAPTLAHHSGAAYDMSRLVTINGTVTALSWKNPHILLTVEAEDADGASRLQEIEVMSVGQARGLGLRRERISPGARVVVRAFPSRSAARARAFGFAVTTSDGAEMPLSSFARFSAAPPPAAAARGLAGTWVPTVESFVTVVSAGRATPLTEAGRAARDDVLGRYAAAGGAGVAICEPLPPPLLHVFPDPRTIEVTDAAVVIRSETNGMKQERVVRLDQAAQATGVDPRVEGHSIGRWEGDTLVIDTVAFAPSRTPDLTWTPTHPRMQLVERLTLTEDRRHLEYVFTLNIPDYLVGPATFRATWDHRPDLEPSAEICDPEAARQIL